MSMNLTATINGTPVQVIEGSVRLRQTVDLRSTLSFVVRDDTGTLNVQPGTPVTLSDVTTGLLFSGYVDHVPQTHLTPNATNLLSISCAGPEYLADKAYTRRDYTGQYAGDIAADLIQSFLGGEGVTADFAIRRDTTPGQFATGTLVNTVAAANVADGDLELTKAGTDLITPLPGFLPPAELALKFVGTAAQGFTNPFHYQKIWGGSLSGLINDALQYEIWISSTSPEIKCGVDLLFSDGSSLRDNDGGNRDWQNLPPHPATDLSGLADDRWYFRRIGIPDGKTVTACTLAFEGDSPGTYTAYVRRIKHMHLERVGDEDIWTERHVYFENQGAPDANVQISNNGYYDVSLSVVSAFDRPASQIDTIDLTSVEIVRSSRITWSVGTVIGNVVIAPPAAPSFGVSAQDTTWTSGGIGLISQANGGLLFDQFLATNGSSTTYGQDTFSRSTTPNGTWGTATDGQVWQHVAGSATEFRVLSNKGQVTNTPLTWDRFLLGVNTGITGDLEIAVRVVVDSVASGFGVWLRADTQGQSGYFVMYDGLNASKGLTIYKLERHRITQLANAGFTITPSSAYWMKAKIVGNLITGKIWLDGAAEPPYDTSHPGGGETEAGSTEAMIASTEILRVETSIDDGASWQDAALQQSVPRLQPGMLVSGRSLLVRRSISAGKFADQSNHFVTTYVQIDSSCVAPKTDVLHVFRSQSAWNLGTFSDVISLPDGGLTLDGYTINFNQVPLNKSLVQLFGDGQDGFIRINQCVIRADNTRDGRLRMNGAGTRQNFTVECDLKIQPGGKLGIEYRTTDWVSIGDNMYAYCVEVEKTKVRFSVGSNGGPAYFTTQEAPVSLSDDTWHHLKVVVNGTTHSAYLDDTFIATWDDVKWTAAGQVGIRYWNGTGTTPNYGYFDNFGVCSALSGTWTSPAISLAGAGTYGTSQVLWDESGIVDTTGAVIETSLDGGATWQSVTNGGAVSGLVTGQSLSGVSLLLRVTLTAASASIQPVLKGLSVLVQGQYSASGSRIAPALQLSTVQGRAGFAQVSWNGLQPAGTSIAIDTSLDGTSWTQAGAGDQGTAPIAGITTQPEPVDDPFERDSSSLYTSTFAPTGSAATWTWDTANSRLAVSGGSLALLPYNTVTWTDGEVWCDTDWSDTGGLIWRYSDASNYYQLVINDDQSSNDPSVLAVFKRVAGVRSFVASAPISLARGTPHRIKVVHVGAQMTVSLDGQVVMTPVDGSLSGAGRCGLASDTGMARFYQFRFQAYGQDVTSLFAYSRVRLSSVNPTVVPQLTDLTLSVRSSAMATGALIPQANYSVLTGKKTTLAQAFDDLAKQSNLVWWLDANKRFFLQARAAQLAPWIVTAADLLNADVQIEQSNPLYRNVQWLTGGMDTRQLTETFRGDGVATSWTVGYPIENVLSVTLNGVAQSIGVKGVDSGRAFYWQAGSNTITLDAGIAPPQVTQQLAITYLGQVSICVLMQDDTQIAQMAAITGTDGMIEVVEDVGNAKSRKVSLLQRGQGLLAQYARMSKKLTATTLRSGLTPGMLLSVFLPEFGIQDEVFLLTDVETDWKTVADPASSGEVTQQPFYRLSATSGPVVGDWARFLLNLVKGDAA
jgi:uncharacterized protein YkuJ